MRRIGITCALALGLAAGLAVNPSGAQVLGEDIMINGFVSQGYLNTDSVDYLIPHSTDGSAAFTEVALTVTALPMDKLRIAAQFLARTFGETSGVTLDWGYGDYHWKDALGVRAGKVKLPYGFYNEVRGLDFLRTPVFLPGSVYNESFREFLQAYSGVGFYGDLDMQGGGGMEYHVFGGTLNLSDASRGYWNDNYTALASTLAPVAEEYAEQEYGPGTAEADLVGVLDSELTFPYVYGGAVTWNTPFEPLRLGATILTGRFNYTATFRYDVIMSNPGDAPRYYPVSFLFDDGNDINAVTTFSGEYISGDLMLAGEYNLTSIDDNTTEGWYAMADYRLFEPLAVAGIYSVYYDDKDNRDGDVLESIGIPSYYAWQKSWTIAARYDITDHWLIKAEYNFMNGVSLVPSRDLTVELEDTRPQYWHMFAARTTFYF